MKKFVLKTSLLGIAGIIGLLPLAAQAQPVTVTPLPATGDFTLSKPKLMWEKSAAYKKNMGNRMDVATTTPLTPIPALMGFRLRFDNGDHKFRRAAVLHKGAVASFAFSDSNGDDPFSAQASWALVHSGKKGEVSGVGGGQFEVGLPIAKVPGHRLVLSGFQLARRHGTDANVRAIGVWLDEETNQVRITLMDDEGPNLSNFEESIGSVTSRPRGIFGDLGLITSNIDQGIRKVEDSYNYRRGYAFTVQYAWIPDDVVSGQTLLSGIGQMPSLGQSLSGPAVLQGFEFTFRNSDHYLLDFGVMPESAGYPDSPLNLSDRRTISFQDNNLDDPIFWGARFLTLQPNVVKNTFK